MFKFLLSTLMVFCCSLHANSGRIDVAPLALRVKVQESGKTIEKLDMQGGRVDMTWQVVDGYGFVLKPFFYGASGGGDLISGGINVGHYTPINEQWTVTPFVGWAGSNLETTIDLPQFGLFRQRERFRASSANLGLELAFKFNDYWVLTGIYQYGWARTRTKIGDLISSKGESQGSSSALVVDYYWTPCWIISAAAAYNNSLSKEKHGIEGYGFKLGVGYQF
jgi:hypothetical protein